MSGSKFCEKTFDCLIAKDGLIRGIKSGKLKKFQHVNILMSLCETLIEHLIPCKSKGIFMIIFYAKRILEIFQKDSFRNDDHLVDWQTSELNYVLMFYRFILFK